MKALLALVATVVLTACPHQPQSQSHTPSAFTPGTEPVPSTALLERFYHVSRSVDSTTRDSVIEIVVQANFRSPRVHCTHLVGPPTRLSLSLTRQTDTTGVNAVLLGVEYEASEALLVGGKRSLLLRLNGSELQPAQAGDPARREAFTRSEKMHYTISSDELRQIVDADTASVHLQGSAGRCDSPVTGHARGLIGLFIERELGDLSAAAKR
jgi:hypothetical protein